MSVGFTLNTSASGRSVPQRQDFASEQAFVAALQQFFEAQKSEVRYVALCEPDGSFRVKDVPPGSYELRAQLYDSALKASNLSYSSNQKDIGYIDRQMVIPENAPSDESFDMGMITLSSREECEIAQ